MWFFALKGGACYGAWLDDQHEWRRFIVVVLPCVLKKFPFEKVLFGCIGRGDLLLDGLMAGTG